MAHINTIFNCCKLLRSDKISERKKQIENLKIELNKSQVVRELDQNKRFNWEDVFDAAVAMVAKETEILRKDYCKANVSSSAEYNREKKKKDCSNLIRLVIKKANERGPKLKCNTILEHVLPVLQDVFTCRAFGFDYCNIILREVLHSHQMWCDITTVHWKELANLFCNLYRKHIEELNQHLLIQIIEKVIIIGFKQAFLTTKPFLKFLNAAFSEIRNEKSSSFQEAVISVAVTFCRTSAGNCRFQLSQLGEKHFNSLLSIWTQCSSDNMKGLLMEFFDYQMISHHPKGVQHPDQGALICNSKTWKTSLASLYRVLMNHISETISRNKYSYGKTQQLHPSFINLMPKVCRQINTEHERKENPQKKIRVQTVLEELMDEIQKKCETDDVIFWLQILSKWLDMFTDTLSPSDLTQILTDLIQLMKACKRNNVLNWLFEVCHSCIGCHLHLKKEQLLSSIVQKNLRCLWNEVYEFALKSQHLNRRQGTSFRVIERILKSQLIQPGSELLLMFCSGIDNPSESNLEALLAFVKNFHIPESLPRNSVSSFISVNTDLLDLYAVHICILDRLFPPILNEDGELTIEENPSIKLRTEILVSLCFRDCIFGNSAKKLPKEKETDDKLEDDYLKATLDCFNYQDLEFSSEHGGISSQASPKIVLKIVQQKLIELLIRNINILTDLEVQTKHLIPVCKECCFVAVVSKDILLKSFPTDQVKNHQLIEKLKVVFRCFIHNLKDVYLNDKNAHLLPIKTVIEELISLFLSCNSSEEAAFLRWIISNELIDFLFSIIQENTCLPASRLLSEASSSTRDISLVDVEMNSDEDLFDSPDASMNVMERQTPDSSFNQSIKYAQELFVVDILSEAQLLRRNTVLLLCLWCQKDKEANLNFLSETSSRSIKLKLIQILNSDQIKLSVAADLQLATTALSTLIGTEEFFDDETLSKIINILKNICRIYYKNIEVGAVCLKLLLRILPHLPNSNQENKEFALHILSGFWKLYRENKVGAPIAFCIIECFSCLMKHDPFSTWSKWESSQDGNNELEPAASSLVQFLQAPQHVVSLSAASSIHFLFNSHETSCEWISLTKTQKSILKNIFEITEDKLKSVDFANADEAYYETSHKISPMLVCLLSIACKSPNSEKSVLYFLLKVIKYSNAVIPFIKKALSHVAQYIGYKSLKDYLVVHLRFLLHCWFQEKYDIMDFPFLLFECSSLDDFYKYHYSSLIPVLFLYQNQNCIDAVSQSLSRTVPDLVEECFPAIIVSLLAVNALKRHNEETNFPNINEIYQISITCNQILDTIIIKEVKNEILEARLDEIVLQLLFLLAHSKNDEGNLNSEVNAAIPYSFSYEIIELTFGHLNNLFISPIKLLTVALSRNPDSVQKILLGLKVSLESARRVHEKQRIFKMFELFIDIISQEINASLKDYSSFIVKDVISVFVSFTVQNIYNQKKDLAKAGCVFLEKICIHFLKFCPDVMAKFLSYIVNSLLPLSNEDSPIKDQVLKIIKLLVFDNSPEIEDYIQDLQPYLSFAFPVDASSQFRHSVESPSLTEEISKFLKIVRNDFDKVYIDRLKYLNSLFVNSKDELSLMLHAFTDDNSSFLDEQEENEILSLVQCLLGIISQTENEKVLEEVGRILGRVGPLKHDCFSVISSPKCEISPFVLQAFQNNYLHLRNAVIFKYLQKLVFSDNIKIMEAASSVLKELLTLKSSQSFARIYTANIEDDLFKILKPFCSTKSKSSSVGLSRNNISIDKLKDVSIWIPDHTNHHQWIKDLVQILLESRCCRDEALEILLPIAKLEGNFCEMLFPYIIHAMLITGNEHIVSLVSAHFRNFFKKFCLIQGSLMNSNGSSGKSSTDESSENSVCINKQSLKTMLQAVHYLRFQDRQMKSSKIQKWENNFWLELDYLDVARTAQYCSSYASSLMYLEIWCDNATRMSADVRNASSSSYDPTCDYYRSTSSNLKGLEELPSFEIIQKLICDAYQSIGERDGMYSCSGSLLLDSSARVDLYENEGHLDRVLAIHDINKQSSDVTPQLDILKVMQKLGLNHTLNVYLQALDSFNKNNSSELLAFQYECAWRNSQWTLSRGSCITSNYHQQLYNAVYSLKDREEYLFHHYLSGAYKAVIEDLRTDCAENIFSINPALAKLSALVTLEDFSVAKLRHPETLKETVSVWMQTDLDEQDFLMADPILALQIVLLQMDNSPLPNWQLHALADRLEKYAQIARKGGFLNIAETSINRLKQLKQLTKIQVKSYQLEEAQIYYARKEITSAMHLMKMIWNDLEKNLQESSTAMELYSKALALYGNWMMETKLESPNIISEFIKKAVDICKKLESRDSLVDAYLFAGRFADAHYQRIINYKRSSAYEAKQDFIQKSRLDAKTLEDQLKQKGNFTKDRQRTVYILKKSSNLDEQEIANLHRDESQFLLQALNNYLKCLQTGNSYNLWIFRLISLWFHNQAVDKVNSLIKNKIFKISTCKFIPLMYQLAARMSTNNEPFQLILNKLIEQMAIDHPYHTLIIILALSNANKDETLINVSTSRASSRTSVSENEQEDRALAASKMIMKLKARSDLTDYISKLENLCDAYIYLSNYTEASEKKANVSISIPKNQPLLKLKNLNTVPILTLEIPVNESKSYVNKLVCIESIDAHFQLCGGINAPKVLTCRGTDGIKRKQLLKGKDDLRQDAVMQQVFSIVNNLLQHDNKTKEQRLKIRTYKVVPLSQRSGILQWCEGTQPFSEYLIGKGDAHNRYYPNDWSALQCRQTMMSFHKSVAEKRLEAYQRICQNFHPVFRHFFLENFPEPKLWLKRRLAYTRSVATSSIVGYVLGLGDRHVQNILIDQETAEFIHIDLGVAFEQGKILPTPEMVPFRLTRDVVDGMGITGVEGIFRRCCEHTLRIIRSSQEVVLTIVEVLLYDPLYTWAISPMKAFSLQMDSEVSSSSFSKSTNKGENVNRQAERTLLRLQQKLQGFEEGITMSISGQVNYLLLEAQEPKNLSRMFPGWQPYI